ncbi:MAG TPA: hypothetical protein VGO73_14195, partial [Pyrinomonadaceae bacterium]|nr:hypothetical protein [Pyrinomonadaceae bacterium]
MKLVAARYLHYSAKHFFTSASKNIPFTASLNIFRRNIRIGFEQAFEGITVRQHADNLMDGYSSAFDTGLSVANARVDGTAIKPDNPPALIRIISVCLSFE